MPGLPQLPRAPGYGLVYFALVFAAGFVLGTIRVLVLEPRLGSRLAELIEIPVMLFVIYGAAKYVIGKLPASDSRSPGLIVGLTGLALLLLCEFTLVLALRGMTPDQYFASRDPLAFGAYLVSLALFGLMPWLLLLGSDRNGAPKGDSRSDNGGLRG